MVNVIIIGTTNTINKKKMENKEQTRIDFLFSMFGIPTEEPDHKKIRSIGSSIEDWHDLYLNAKIGEMGQIIDAWNDGYEKGLRVREEKIINPVFDAETYYDDTYGKYNSNARIIGVDKEDITNGLGHTKNDRS